MGREEAISQYEEAKNAKIADAYAAFLKDMQVVGEKQKMMDDNLGAFLQMDQIYTDKEGKSYHVCGSKNDKENGTLGRLDIFEGPEFKGQPFHEVSRNMADHFRMFALANGAAEADILAMSESFPSDEVYNRLAPLRKEFYEMVLNKDVDKIADMYATFAKQVTDKGAQLNQMADGIDGIQKNKDNIMLYHGGQSYLNQTLKLGDTVEPDTTKELVGMINAKLKEKGVNYDLYQFQNYVDPLFLMGKGADRAMSHEISAEEMGEAKKDIFDPILEEEGRRGKKYSFKEMPEQILNLTKPAAQYKQYQEQAKKTGSVAQGMAEIPYDKKFYLKLIPTQDGTAKKEEFFDLTDVKNVAQKDLADVSDISSRVSNNIRKGYLWGTKSNTPQYEAVKTALENAAKLEKDMKDKKIDLSTKEGKEALQSLKDAYASVETAAKDYLDHRDPRSPQGIDRYKLILEAQDIAKGQKKLLENAAENRRDLIKPDMNLAPARKRAGSVHIQKQDFNKLMEQKEKQAEAEKQAQDKGKKKSKISRLMQEKEQKERDKEVAPLEQAANRKRSNSVGKK